MSKKISEKDLKALYIMAHNYYGIKAKPSNGFFKENKENILTNEYVQKYIIRCIDFSEDFLESPLSMTEYKSSKYLDHKSYKDLQKVLGIINKDLKEEVEFRIKMDHLMLKENIKNTYKELYNNIVSEDNNYDILDYYLIFKVDPVKFSIFSKCIENKHKNSMINEFFTKNIKAYDMFDYDTALNYNVEYGCKFDENGNLLDNPANGNLKGRP